MTMRHLSRLGLALVLTLGVLASAPALAGNIDGALKYVPADFTTVVVVDVAALQRSAFGAMVKGMVDNNPGAKAMEKEVGFDATKDLTTFVVAGPDAMMSHDEQMIVVIEAKIDAEKLVGFIKSQGEGVTEKKVNGVTMFMVDKDGAFAIDGGFIIGGYAPLVEKALAAKSGKNVTSGPLKTVIKQFKGSKGAFAAISAGKKVREVLGGDLPAFGQLETAGFGLDASKGAGVKIIGNFATARDAAQVAEGLQQMMKDAAGDPDIKEMGLAPVIGGVSVKADGKALEIGVKMTDAQIQQLMGAVMGGQ